MYEKLENFLMVLASILMHLSEKKHGLNGIYPFNDFSYQFLWFDRIMAYWCILRVIIKINNCPIDQIGCHLILGLFGLSLNLLSEKFPYKYIIPYAIMHCIWHLIAYYIKIKVGLQTRTPIRSKFEYLKPCNQIDKK